MYVKNVTLTNFRKIESFSYNFNGGIYFIKGENELGKTALIEAIITLLTGERNDNLLQKGKDSGAISATVGEGENEYTVELKFTEKNPRGTIKVTHNPTGMSDTKVSFLQNLFHYQEFDAHEFVMWSESAEGRRKQISAVKGLLPDDVVSQIEKIDSEIKEKKEDRKTLNSTEVYLSGKIDQTIDLTILEKPAPKKDEIQSRLKKAYATNEKRKTVSDSIIEIDSFIDTFDAECENFKTKRKENNGKQNTKLAELKKQYEESIASAEKDYVVRNTEIQEDETKFHDAVKEQKESKETHNIWLFENKEVKIEEINLEIEEANKLEKLIEEAKVHKKQKTELETIQKSISDANEFIENKSNEKTKLLKVNKLPIDGLTFDDDYLYLNDIKVRKGDISTSQEIELATKLIMAKNPKVKVFKIMSGESLGEKRLKDIVDFANENGYQGFIEEVERGNNKLTIEEYTIK